MKANTEFGLLVLRLALGIILFAHGAQKLLGWFGGMGSAAFVGWMRSIHIPAFLAWLAILTEFLGGLAILLGPYARIAALAVVIEMVVAIFLVHWRIGFFMNWGSVAGRGEGYEFTLLVLASALALVFTGPGRLGFALRRGDRGQAS